jgi:deoxyribodipyrimidine photo-lyase
MPSTPEAKYPVHIHWMRRDMRLDDNRALHSAIEAARQSQGQVLIAFIFDSDILDKLDNAQDRRVAFLHQTLTQIDQELGVMGSGVLVGYGAPPAVWAQWISHFREIGTPIQSVHVGRDYEPYAQERDRKLAELFQSSDIAFKGIKDSVIFEKSEVVKDDGKPYTVFTPFSKKWRKALKPSDYAAVPSSDLLAATPTVARETLAFSPIPTLASMGFTSKNAEDVLPDSTIDREILLAYGAKRDFPSVRGTSRISLHLRFGTVGIREALRAGLQHSEKWTTELIWRDFYQMIIYHFPHSAENSFRPAYDAIPWVNNEAHFEAWCDGRTGYPLVDAGMRELVATGFMHNRVRMVVASFLCKHLLTDWRWGERFFARHLLDFDLASNAGGWQWAAGSGCDAAPYFRVFNPTAQLEKFDKELRYVRKWVPEYGTSAYPEPIVDHATARKRAIETYQSVLKPA